MQSILNHIGHTPLVPLRNLSTGSRLIWGKCEHLNPGGSVKDRIALAIVDAAEASGELKPGGTLIEATAGNTGVGLAIVAALRGYQLICVMPEKMSMDKRQALRAMGAKVVVTENAPPGDPRNFQSVAKQMAQDIPNSFWTNQFSNHANPLVHEQTTGPEIWSQQMGRSPPLSQELVRNHFCVGRYLKSMNQTQNLLADPLGSRLADLINGTVGEDGATC